MGMALANLPFLSQRLFGLVGLKSPKSAFIRLTELLAFYAFTGVTGLFLERGLGQQFPQGWEFYAITLALFLTFAFPGFTYCYLFKRRGN